MFEIIEGGTAPLIKTELSSSADLCSRVDITVQAGETAIIPLGVKIDLKYMEKLALDDRLFFGIYTEFEHDKEIINHFLKSHFFELKPRSSLPLKKGLIIANGVGEIDLDYPDEIGLIVHFPFKYAPNLDIVESVTIKAGEPVAQIKLMPHKNNLMPSEYRKNAKRVGGFGSTGSEPQN